MPQSLSNVLLHVVFSTKHCVPFLLGLKAPVAFRSARALKGAAAPEARPTPASPSGQKSKTPGRSPVDESAPRGPHSIAQANGLGPRNTVLFFKDQRAVIPAPSPRKPPNVARFVGHNRMTSRPNSTPLGLTTGDARMLPRAAPSGCRMWPPWGR